MMPVCITYCFNFIVVDPDYVYDVYLETGGFKTHVHE